MDDVEDKDLEDFKRPVLHLHGLEGAERVVQEGGASWAESAAWEYPLYPFQGEMGQPINIFMNDINMAVDRWNY